MTLDDHYIVTCASSVIATDPWAVSTWFDCSTFATDSNNFKRNICETSELKRPKMTRPLFLLSFVLYYIIPNV